MTDGDIKNNLLIAIGRINGIHAFSLTLARCLPSEVASKCAYALSEAIEKIEADLIALPVEEVLIEEQLRVTKQFLQVLHLASQSA